jgi:hypothetical protein
MTKKNKWMTLAAIVFGGGTLFHSGGCGLNGFWQGFFNGFPPNNLQYSIILDILNEELFG